MGFDNSEFSKIWINEKKKVVLTARQTKFKHFPKFANH